MGTAARIKQVLLGILMVGLTGAAALAVFVLLVETEGETAARSLATAGLLAAFALTGLCAALPMERGILPAVGIVGIGASAVGFLLGLAYTWELLPVVSPEDLRPLLLAFVAAVVLGWASLLLLRVGRSAAVTASALATIVAVAALGALFLVHLLGDPRTDAIARAMTIAGILAVLGSFLTPMLDKVLRLSPPARAAGFSGDERPPPPSDP